MNKRMSLGFGFVLSACLALAACGSGDPDPGSSGDSSANVPFYSDKASWEPQFQKVSDQSVTENGFGLDITGYSDSNAYTSFIKQAFRTSAKPTLFTWHTGDSLKELVNEGLVVETTDQWKKSIDAGDVPAGLADYYTIDGKQYCVPLNSVYWVMYYNKKVFADNGITPPASWADMIAASDKLKAAGVTPFYQTNQLFNFVWFQTILAGQDPAAYEGLSTGKVKYTDPAVVTAMNTWKDMMDKGYFTDPGVSTEPSVLLQTGQIGMLNFGSFMTGQLTALGLTSGTDYGTFVIPAVNPDLKQTPLIVETSPICQASDASGADNAAKWVDWWMQPSAQNAWAESTQSASFNPKATVFDKGLEQVQTDVGNDKYQLLQRYFEAAPAPVLTAALDGFGEFISSPGDPLPILQRIQDAADTYWADQK